MARKKKDWHRGKHSKRDLPDHIKGMYIDSKGEQLWVYGKGFYRLWKGRQVYRRGKLFGLLSSVKAKLKEELAT